ncbi:sulfite dehydrogenase (cytochrome) subunit SorA apoprotein [Stella humosa]|uniref:Sulfite dehydrogenase (Cytochrome) subunit SorA apoprotein n=1 Tax=Stella humosa TaxID=94 RepID=A0A3N1LHY7_9PROT|nr:sulfite oxidase [Stella humosa]ROP90880.1 sulfite dehydrogenase (cytochrome) subunit SorA apoprotein [Stella humosa]BBK34771.1 molybdopterin containing oxidoreductase [Stella humosa]
MRRERGIDELYRDDPERADALVFGRRGLLKGAGLAAMGAAVGGAIPFAGNLPTGLVPGAMAQAAAGPKILKMDGKADLVLLGDRPLVAETPEYLLDDDVTPTDKFFIRNNGQVPEPTANPDAWELTIDGEVNTPLKLTLGELKKRFPHVTYRLQLECGGNGRAAFSPEARGNQWTNGGVGNAEWTGVRLRDVLQAAGVKPSAVYTGNYAADPHLSGDASRITLSRGVPIAKAMEEHTILAFAMNGQPLPPVHGFPLRVIAPGYPGSASAKWLTRITLRDREHDGAGMTGTSYRVPKTPMIPGGKADEKDFVILESMPVRAILTNLRNGTELAAGTRKVALRGHAWAGEETVKAVDVSHDFGQTWQACTVDAPPNKYCWQNWRTEMTLPSAGYFEFWVRGTDSRGRMQPAAAANWNPQGYGGNAIQRVAVLIKA